MKQASKPVGSRLARWVGLAVAHAEKADQREQRARSYEGAKPLFSLNRDAQPLGRVDIPEDDRTEGAQ